jgi:AGCS family alanine or glycine:cation symporter
MGLTELAQGLADAINGVLEPIADWLGYWVWNWPELGGEVSLIAILLVGAGIYVTLRLGMIQLRGFRHAIDITRGVYDNPEDDGDLSHFQALTTALSATVGIGNIAGVAIAIRMGGPGALFWMWLTAFFGMALKYAECTLAIKFRKHDLEGGIAGGPMYYIEMGLGSKWKWMAVFFAVCGTISSMGSGCMNQSNTLAAQLNSSIGMPMWLSGAIFASVVAAVILGGIKRIGKVTAILAPSMALLYVGAALVILLLNFGAIPGAFATIIKSAFNPDAILGGGAGSIMLTMMWGIRRGLFSNEAGQGSAPIAHATAKTDHPAREGLVASLGPFIDTIIICTMTGLVIISTGVYKDKMPERLTLAAVEGLAVAGVADADVLTMEAARDAGTLEVIDGKINEGSLLFLSGVVEEAHLEAADGSAWSGSLAMTEDGDLSVRGGGVAPTVVGNAYRTGATLTSAGFAKGLPGFGTWIVTLAVILFAVSTGISWSYYGDRMVGYIFPGGVKIYRMFFVFAFFVGTIMPLESVWNFGDAMLGLMSFPNLLALLMLTGVVVKETKSYMAQKDSFPKFK